MNNPLRFSIRLKILVALLFVVTGVVGVIVVTMANLFHADKKAYITDLVSTVSVGAAEECRSLLIGYEERLWVYGRILENEDLSAEARQRLLQSFFDDFPELVALSLHGAEREIATVYNGGLLEEAGLTKRDLVRFREEHPLRLDEIVGDRVHLANTSLSPELPVLTLSLAWPSLEGGLISAVIALDSMQQLARRAEGFNIYIVDADGVYLADKQIERVTSRKRVRGGITQQQTGISAAEVREYVEDGVEMIGGFASTRFGGVTVGVRIPKSAAYLASSELLYRLLIVALAMLIGAALVGVFWAHRLTRPIARLSAATHDIARGRFETRVEVESRDEIGELAGSFNRMATGLHDREAALKETQTQLIQSEKMAAFGQLGAGIAHEVKNPLAGILGCAQLSLRKVEKGTPVEKNLQLIEKETRRCKAIIENLLRFARQEKAVLQPIQINPVVTDAVAIVGHQLGMHAVQLEQDLASDLPEIQGNANQLQQVLMNLIMNAQQAFEGQSGTVRVSTRLSESGRVTIAVQDDGPGIPPPIREKLFEPFFTTKPGGKGTGLGLSVSFGIVKDHGGEITVASDMGRGTTFSIVLPTMAEQPAPRSYVAVGEI